MVDYEENRYHTMFVYSTKVSKGMKEFKIIDKVRWKVEQRFFITKTQEFCAQLQEFVQIQQEMEEKLSYDENLRT